MKKKALTYGLAMIVLVIWAKVGYDIFSFGNNELENFKVPQIGNTTKNNEREPQGKINLDKEYKDPFLKELKYNQNERKGQSNSQVSKQTDNSKKETVRWPSVRYLGRVQNNSTSESRAILKVNGDEKVVAMKEVVVDQIMVKAITRDSVILMHGRETKVFYK